MPKSCKHCGSPVILIPPAAERARKYGESPSYYTNLFDYHADCQIKANRETVSALMKKLKKGV